MLKNIEFLRVILMFNIVWLHSYIKRDWNITQLYPDVDIFQNLLNMFNHSNNSVEAFFIISGFLLAYTFKPTKSLKSFILNKYIRLSPVIAFTLVFCLVNYILRIEPFPILSNLSSILLTNIICVNLTPPSVGVAWFTSSLFLVMLAYFCLLKFSKEKYHIPTLLFFVALGYGLLEHFRHGVYKKNLNIIFGCVNVGLLRAIAGIALGCIIGILYKKYFPIIKEKVITYQQKLFLNFIEISSFAFIIWWSIIPHKKINNIFYVLVFTIFFMTFLCQKGFLSKVTNTDFWVKLGKYQYSIFVTHVPILKFLDMALWRNAPYICTHLSFIPIIANYLIVLIIGILTYRFIENPCFTYLSNKYKEHCFKKNKA